MRIAYPYFLSFLWIIPALVLFYLWAFRRKDRLIEKFVSPELKARLMKDVSPYRQKLKAITLTLACLFLVLAVIRPKWGFHWEEVKRRGVDIMIALDVSQSMMAQDIEPSRLERAKRKIIDFLKIVQGDRIGLIAFAGVSFLQCPLTLDYGTVQLFLDYLSPDLIPVPGTAIAAAIDEAVKSFGQSAKKSRALVLITDGEDHEGNPLEAAKRASEAGAKIYVIGIGNNQGAPIPNVEGGGFKKDSSGNVILTQLNEEMLQKIALETGGSYVRSVSGDLDLEKIYDNIHKSLDENELKSGRQQRFEERFQWPLLIAILLLFIETLIPERKIASYRLNIRKITWPRALNRKLVLSLGILFGIIAVTPAEGSSATRGEREYQQSKYNEALKSLLDAQIEDPNNLKLKYNLANTYYKLNEFDKAEKLFQTTALQGEKAFSEKSYYNLGNTEFRLGKLNESIAYYQKALELNPKDDDARYNLEFVREELKRRIEESKKTAEQQKQSPQNTRQKQPSQSEQKNPQNQNGQPKSQENDKKDQQQPQAQNGQQKPENQDKEEASAEGKRIPGKEMTKEEAERWLSTLKKEDRKKFLKNAMSQGRRYRVEKDW